MTTEEILTNRVGFCKYLSAMAREKKITQEQLAEKTGMKQSVINRIFSGKTSPTLDSLINVANAIGVEITLSTLQQ